MDDRPDPNVEQRPTVVLSEERLVPAVRRAPYRRLRVAKRVVVEQQTVTVEVRREELVVEELDLDGDLGGGSGATAGTLDRSDPLVLVLSREVPDQVLLRTEPVEVVRVHVDQRSDVESVEVALRRERVDVRGVDARGVDVHGSGSEARR